MARINVEDKLFRDKRFSKLVSLLNGDIEKAIGALVLAWACGQKYYLKNGGYIPKKEWDDCDLNNNLITSGMAVIINDNVYMRGSEESFAWLRQKSAAGIKSGKKRNERVLTGVDGCEPPTLTPTLTHKNKNIIRQNKVDTLGVSTPLASEKSLFNQEQLNNWIQIYTEGVVRDELAKARAWLAANPKRAKKNFARFFNGWLSRGAERKKQDALKAQENLPKRADYVV